MHHLVVCPLEKRGINSRKGPVTIRRQSSGEGHTMLLGDADIETAVRKLLLKFRQSRARWHSSGNRHNLFVPFPLTHQLVGKYVCVVRRVRLGFCLRPGHYVKAGDAMIFVR